MKGDGRVYQRKEQIGTTMCSIQYYANGRRIRLAIGSPKNTLKQNEKLARDVLHTKLGAKAENRYLDIKRDEKVKFSDFVQEYLNAHARNKRSYQKDIEGVKVLNNAFGNRYLREITKYDVVKFKNARSQEVSGPSTNRNLALLKCVFNKAGEWGRFDGKNPVKGVKFFPENRRLRFLETEQIDALLSNCPERLMPIVAIAVWAGLRIGEIQKLKWREVNFERNTVYVPAFNAKSGRDRTLPLNPRLSGILLRIRKRAGSPYIFCDSKDDKPYGGDFTNLRKDFFTACIKASIIKTSKEGKKTVVDETEKPKFRFHDLRHTFASQLAMSGVDLNTIRELMGHANLDMTLRYSHLSLDHKANAIKLLTRRFGNVSRIVAHEKTAENRAQNFETPNLDNSLEHKELVHAEI